MKIRVLLSLVTLVLTFASSGSLRGQWVATNGPFGGAVSCYVVSGPSVIAGTDHGVFLSTNNGGSWVRPASGAIDEPVDAMVALGLDLVFSAATGNVYRSTDAGAHWFIIDIPGKANIVIQHMTVSGNLMYAAASGGGESGPPGIYRSSDSGATWSAMNNQFNGVTALTGIDSYLLAGTASGVAYSTDSGVTWTRVSLDVTAVGVTSLTTIGRVIIAGSLGRGAYRSTDSGATWQSSNVGMTSGTDLSLATIGAAVYAGTIAGVCRSTDSGASWMSANSGIGNSPAYAFAMSGPNLLAGTKAGCFISTNNASSWSASNAGLSVLSVAALTSNGATVLAGSNNGIFRSTDAGSGWSDVKLNTEIYSFTHLGRYIVAATALGVYRSEDDGVSWQQINTGLTNVRINTLEARGNILFAASAIPLAGSSTFIYVSTDSGATWTSRGGSIPDNATITAFARSGKALLAVSPSPHVLFRSTDSGATWLPLMTDLPDQTSISFISTFDTIVYIFNSNDGYLYRSTGADSSWTKLSQVPVATSAIALHDSNLFASTSSGIYVSTDGGISWAHESTGLSLSDAVFVFASDGRRLFVGTRASKVLHTTDDGVTWSAISTVSKHRITALLPTGPLLFAGVYAEGVYLSRDSGAHWDSASAGLGNDTITCLAATNGMLFAGTYQGIYRSTNGGASWSNSDNGLPPNSWIATISVQGSHLFAGTRTNGMYHSSNNGSTWQSLNTALPTSIPITSLVTDDHGGLFAGGSGVFRSSDSGMTWESFNSGLSWPHIFAMAMYRDSLYAGTNGFGPFRSSWSAPLWSTISTGFPSSPYLVTFHKTNTNLFSGDYAFGVFRLNDDGQSWTNISAGLSRTDMTSLTSTSSDLFAATKAGVIWRRPLKEVATSSSGVAEEHVTKSNIQCFPNPTTTSTTISITPEATGYAEISIVNMLGQTVATVYSGELDASEHRFTWEAQAKACATPGVYECVVRINGGVQTLPIVVE